MHRRSLALVGSNDGTIHAAMLPHNGFDFVSKEIHGEGYRDFVNNDDVAICRDMGIILLFSVGRSKICSGARKNTNDGPRTLNPSSEDNVKF